MGLTTSTILLMLVALLGLALLVAIGLLGGGLLYLSARNKHTPHPLPDKEPSSPPPPPPSSPPPGVLEEPSPVDEEARPSRPSSGRTRAVAPRQGEYVKRASCPACGSPKQRPSLSAYVYCDYCGQLMDWDFQACLSDRRSRLPGPQYEALLRELGTALKRCKEAGDREGYEVLQRQIFSRYVELCPAACPPRIAEPRYRAAFVAHSAAVQTMADFDPDTHAGFLAQNQRVQALHWDSSDPRRPMVRPDTFWPLLDVVLHNQRHLAQQIEAQGLLASHPDHPPREILVKIGLSVMAQGWLPYLRGDDRDALLQRCGLDGDYTPVTPVDLANGACPCCGGRLEMVAGARRILCHACGHLVGVGEGTVACHQCSAPIHLRRDRDRLNCSHCQAELLVVRPA